jgi:hypothetical protein
MYKTTSFCRNNPVEAHRGASHFEAQPNVIKLPLTPGQTEQLAPLAIEAAGNRENVLFVAAAVPFWSPKDGETVWELQVISLPAKIGHKILKLVRDS